jgi:hypothetical protein
MVLQRIRLDYAFGKTSSRARQVCLSGAARNSETKFGMRKKGERDSHTPHSGVLRSQEEKKQALVRLGEWCSARLSPALTLGEFSLFVAAM